MGDSAGNWSHGLRDLPAAGPDGLATATEAEAPALMFKKHLFLERSKRALPVVGAELLSGSSFLGFLEQCW